MGVGDEQTTDRGRERWHTHHIHIKKVGGRWLMIEKDTQYPLLVSTPVHTPPPHKHTQTHIPHTQRLKLHWIVFGSQRQEDL